MAYIPGGRERERATLIARREKELELEEYRGDDGGDIEIDSTSSFRLDIDQARIIK